MSSRMPLKRIKTIHSRTFVGYYLSSPIFQASERKDLSKRTLDRILDLNLKVHMFSWIQIEVRAVLWITPPSPKKLLVIANRRVRIFYGYFENDVTRSIYMLARCILIPPYCENMPLVLGRCRFTIGRFFPTTTPLHSLQVYGGMRLVQEVIHGLTRYKQRKRCYVRNFSTYIFLGPYKNLVYIFPDVNTLELKRECWSVVQQFDRGVMNQMIVQIGYVEEAPDGEDWKTGPRRHCTMSWTITPKDLPGIHKCEMETIGICTYKVCKMASDAEMEILEEYNKGRLKRRKEREQAKPSQTN